MIRKPLEVEERCRILKLRKGGMSILSISREIHRSKKLVSAFLKDPVNYLKSNTKDENITNDSSSVPYNKLTNETLTPPQKKKTNLSTTIKGEPNTNSTNVKSSTSSSSLSSIPPSVKKVSFEHRSVIKFLTKKGWNSIAIHDDMKHVYKSSAPSLNSIEYWIKECTRDPSINFDKTKKSSPSKNIKKNGKKCIIKNTIEKAKSTMTKSTKKENCNNNPGTIEKEKNDKNNLSTTKSLLTFKLFDNPLNK